MSGQTQEGKMFKAAIVGALAFGLTRPADVVLSGTAKDCAGRNYVQVPGVNLAAFDPAQNPQLVGLLKSMDTADFVDADLAAMARFTAKYSELVRLVSTLPALARTTSNAAGEFSLSVSTRDSVLVVGYQLTEDEPNYYSHRFVAGQTNGSFVLDMSRGECHYP
jgi:hypothetical protein